MLVTLDNVEVEKNGEKILKNVNFSINRGDKILILGPNGSGKTTLIKAMLGLVPVTSGEVVWKNRIGVMSNLELLSSFSTLTCEEIAKFFADIMGCNLGEFHWMQNRLKLPRNVFNKEIKKLSYGQAKAFRNLLAITCGWNFTLLDEPFESIDPSRKVILFNVIQGLENSRAILVVTHETWVLKEIGDWKSYLMIEGRLYGPVEPQKLLNSKTVPGKIKDAFLHLELGNGTFSLVPSDRENLTRFITLDEFYLTLVGGEK